MTIKPMRSRNGARQPLQPQPQPLLGGGGGGPQGCPPPKSQLALRGLGPPMPGPPNPPGPPGPGPNPCIAAPFNCGHCPQLTHLVAAPLQLLAEIYVSRLAKNCQLFALGCFALVAVAKKQELFALRPRLRGEKRRYVRLESQICSICRPYSLQVGHFKVLERKQSLFICHAAAAFHRGAALLADKGLELLDLGVAQAAFG